MKKKHSRKPQINVEATRELFDELDQISEKTQMPKTQIVREAVWEKIALLKQTHPALQQIALDK